MFVSRLFTRTSSQAPTYYRANLHLTSVENSRKTYLWKYGYGEKPLFNTEKYLAAEEDGSLEELKYKKIRPANAHETDTVFYDDTYERYIRRMMVDGRLSLMYQLMHNACYEIKCKQYRRLRKQKEKLSAGEVEAKQLEEDKIIMDPIELFHKALANCRPQVITRKVKRGGATYQVPYPLTASDSDWYAMHWMNKTLKERAKPREKHYHEVLAQELLDASEGRGKIVKMKDDVHRLAQANKAYSHYRWG